MAIKSFLNLDLKEIWETGKSRRIPRDQHKRARQRLDALHTATEIAQLQAQPGYRTHFNKQWGRWSLWVSGPWRVTFQWIDGHAYRVDLEQYH